MEAQDIERIVIAGAGTMGYSMAQIFARYGYQVTIYDLAQSALDNAATRIAQGTENLVADGDITRDEGDGLLAHISYTREKACFATCDLMVESIVERLDVKTSFYREISELARPDAILATNTSGLSINELAAAVKLPQRFIGMHWFNPSHIIPLIEIVRGDETSDEAADTVRNLARAIGKKPVVAQKDVPGFVRTAFNSRCCARPCTLWRPAWSMRRASMTSCTMASVCAMRAWDRCRSPTSAGSIPSITSRRTSMRTFAMMQSPLPFSPSCSTKEPTA